MTIEQQVTSLELSEKLRELRVRQESLFYWTHCPVKEQNGEWTHVLTYGRNNELPETYAAFTVAELGEMLPLKIQRPSQGKDGDWFYLEYDDAGKSLRYLREFLRHNEPQQEYLRKDRKDAYSYAHTEADARAKMLIYLLENKLITL